MTSDSFPEKTCKNLVVCFLSLAQASNGSEDGGSSWVPQLVSSTGHSLFARSALPDTNHLALHVLLSAEWAREFTVLADLNLTKHFTDGGTIPGTVLSGDADLLGAFSHCGIKK